MLKWFFQPQRDFVQNRFYRLLLFVTSLYLIMITVLQCFFVNTNDSFFLQISSALMAVFTIYLFGRVIPTLLSPAQFIEVLKILSVLLCFISFLLLFLSPATSFKGTRFIGVFKHIPHMVSCATLACFAIFYSIFTSHLSRVKLIINWIYFIICFFLLLLTGTRSALAAVIVGFVLCMVIYTSSTWMNRFLKVSLALSFLFIVLFFGHEIADYSVAIVRGEQSIANRMAQDGLKTRIEEIERGLVLFEKNEWLGQGLLMKFANGSEADLNGYNANKDPHNVFVSAGVVGGWGFVVLTSLGFIALFISTLKSLVSKNEALKLLAIYLITHLPILMIYHVHLSIGGIADRVYWIIVGYMVLKKTK